MITLTGLNPLEQISCQSVLTLCPETIPGPAHLKIHSREHNAFTMIFI
jgi:hypothetical protein